MELRVIESAEFDQFVANSDKSHFMQTSGWADVSNKRNYISHLLGAYKNNELVATALLLERKIGPFSTFYCPRGPIVDYSNLDLLKELFFELKTFVKKNKGLYLKIDPDIIIRKLDEDAKPIQEYETNIELIKYLESLGFKHRGFTTRFNESSNPRFTFRVDVSKDEKELLNSFHNTTKKILRRENPYNLSIRKGDITDVKNFYKTMEDTAKRKKMYLEPESYFTDFYELLNNKNMSDIYIVEAELNELVKAYEVKQMELQSSYDDLKNFKDKKKEVLKNELDNRKNKLKKEFEQIKEIKEEKIVLSSIITAKFDDKVWTIHGGNSDRLMFLDGNYELYYEILKQSHNEGYKYVDFFGSEGEVNKESNIYGIYLFKLRFGGDFDEFIGEFDLITRPFFNLIIQKLLIIRRKIKFKKNADLAQG